MQLNLDHLYQILTTESFLAADRLKPMFGATTQSQYDQIVQNIASELKSIVMWDGEIEEGARQTLVRNVIERTDVESFMHDDVDRQFIVFVQQQAPEALHDIVKNLDLNAHKISVSMGENGRPAIKKEWLHGAWMPEHPLKDALAGLAAVHNVLRFSRAEREIEGEKRLGLIAAKLKNESAGTQRLFENYLCAFEDHPLKDYYIQWVGYQSPMPKLSSSKFDFNKCLSEDTANQIALVYQEMHALWTAFAPTRIDILSRHVGQNIRQRCNALMECMVKAPMVELHVEVDKSSVERFREKDNTIPTQSITKGQTL